MRKRFPHTPSKKLSNKNSKRELRKHGWTGDADREVQSAEGRAWGSAECRMQSAELRSLL